MCANGEQRRCRQYGRIAHQRGFGSTFERQHQRTPVVTCRQHHRQCAANRAQVAGQRQFARELVIEQPRLRHLPARGENADGDRQGESTRLLRQVGGREAHRHLARRKLELRVLQRCAHPIARFAHLGVREPNDMHARQPACEMHFDANAGRGHARQRAAVNDRDRHRPPGSLGRGVPNDRHAARAKRYRGRWRDAFIRWD